ncbi:MAG: lipoprotein-like protein [Paenibacillus sp.]|jgi:spore germination protein D|nr:lipoprotein-like protein [Paenibacillus sp.]
MNAKHIRWIPVLLLPLLASCGSGSGQESSQNSAGGYKETKSMVLDILKTEEGKKAIMEASLSDQNSQMKLLSTDTGQQVQLAVKDILTAQDTDVVVRQIMTDPKFAGDFAKAIQKQNKQLQKDLMKDPEYQKQMLDLMKNSEFEKLVMEIMKTTPYRAQTMTVMQDALQSPLVKAEMLQLLKKVVDEQSNPQAQDKKKEGEQGKKDEQSKEQDKESSK